MKPFFALLLPFAMTCLVFYIIRHDVNLRISGCIAMSVMLVFTSAVHFVAYKGMILIVPKFIPFKRFMVYLTGVIQIAAAIGLVIPATTRVTGYLLIVFFVVVFPANIVAAQQKVNLKKATHDGKGLSYLWFRIPLQLFLIAWVWYFAVR